MPAEANVVLTHEQVQDGDYEAVLDAIDRAAEAVDDSEETEVVLRVKIVPATKEEDE